MTVRVNVEFDLWASGRLGAFARAMGVNECEALGVLVFVWHETQHRELALVTKELFASSISIRLGGYDAAMIFESMAKAGLLSHVDDQTWLIRGNDEHVSRLKKLRVIATAGGNASVQARAKLPVDRTVKRTLKRTVDRTVKLPVERTVELQLTYTEPSPNPPKLLSSLAPIQDPDLTTSDSDFAVPPQSADLPSKGTTSKNEVAPPSATARIRMAYLEGYQRKFGKPFIGWGGKANGQAKNLIRDWPADRVVELVGLFFEWNNPRAIMAGYPFGFFVTAIQELDTDTHSPERKRFAGALQAGEHQVSKEDAEKLKFEQDMARLRRQRAQQELDASLGGSILKPAVGALNAFSGGGS